MQRKRRLAGKKNSRTCRNFFSNWSFHRIFFVLLKSSHNMILSDWIHTFFDVSCSACMFSANMQLEPSLLRGVANHEWNPPKIPHRIAKPWKRCSPLLPGNLNRVKTPGFPRVSPNRGRGRGVKWLFIILSGSIALSWKQFAGTHFIGCLKVEWRIWHVERKLGQTPWQAPCSC